MKNWPFAASYERGIALVEAGCPIDFPEVLPRQSSELEKSFRATQLTGYAESRIYRLGPLLTGFILGLRLATSRSSGTIISQWTFVPPWDDHLVSWDYEPKDIIPQEHLHVYKPLLRSRLIGILSESRLLKRGYPVTGILCGRSDQPIGVSIHNRVTAKLILNDDLGNSVKLRVGFNVGETEPDRRRSIWGL